MRNFFRSLFSLLIAILLLGAVFNFVDSYEEKNKEPEINDSTEGGDENTPGNSTDIEPNVIGGVQGFTTDFSGLTLTRHATDEYRLVNANTTTYPSQLFLQDGTGVLSTDNGALSYECTESGASSTYPKFKIKPLSYSSKLYLSQFRVLTVDFDIEYKIDYESQYSYAFCALFNTRSMETDGTVCSNNDYYRFDESGKGHYTFIYYDTGSLDDMKIFVYKDGVLVDTIENFIHNAEYDADDLYVACLNLELTRNEGDKISIDNIEFHYFDESYTGPIIDLVENPDVNLRNCKDSVLYGG